jgi:hypothetical protein
MRGRAAMGEYRLAKGAVECGEHGLSIGGVALLERRQDGGGFRPRDIAAINDDLSFRYGASIDAGSKAAGLAFIASSLAAGELALAQIGALMLRFPDPPAAGTNLEQSEGSELSAMLDVAGLLTRVWEDGKYLRLGGPPNAGWFAGKPKDAPPQPPAAPEPEPPRWRRWLGWLAGKSRIGPVWFRLSATVAERISTLGALIEYGLSFFADPSLQPSTGDVIADEYGAEGDPPKTLEELQRPPTHFQLGYDLHHIVEQNPANIAKRIDYWLLLLRKFGRTTIDDPSNLIWVPRRLHWKITGLYNRKEDGDSLGRLHRKVINELDFAAQREAGLAALREVGVLK